MLNALLRFNGGLDSCGGGSCQTDQYHMLGIVTIYKPAAAAASGFAFLGASPEELSADLS